MLDSLSSYFARHEAMAIAVSGGVDSMTLAVVAHRANPGTQVFHAISPAVPAEATRRVKKYAAQENWQLTIINAGEMQDEKYLANPANRCYFCKTNLYDTVSSGTELTVASGTNLDDLGDYRPGLVAAEEHKVCHPYVDLGITKENLRQIATTLELDDLKDLPAAPCLSSRVLTGIAINPELLPVIDEVELGVRRLLGESFQTAAVRCRIRESEVGIQVDAEVSESLSTDIKTFVHSLFVERGFARQVSRIVIEPYKMGSAFLINAVEVSG